MNRGGFNVLDDLVLQLKGLVLVSKLRESRGADPSELELYSAEIQQVRERLADLVRSGRATIGNAETGA